VHDQTKARIRIVMAIVLVVLFFEGVAAFRLYVVG